MDTPRGTYVPKSLHTLTVLCQVARHVASCPVADRPAPPIADALDEAIRLLGLSGRPDPHGLRARALVLLMRGNA